MKFLIIEQDLRISGTSQGIISRSFLAKLREAYPNSVIDVVYLKQAESDDHLDLLPVNSIKTYTLNVKVPFFTIWANKISWRLFNVSLKERYIQRCFRTQISKIKYDGYNHIFIRSAGLEHETILASKGLPILKKAIVNFHDPYPLFWYAGSITPLSKLDLFRLKEMEKVVAQAKSCMSSAQTMSEDLQFLYGSRKPFYTLPHQYSKSVFNFSDTKGTFNKTKELAISYHGAIQFGRDIEIVLDTYVDLIKKYEYLKKDTEFFLRVKGVDLQRMRKKYAKVSNITILETLNFSTSAYEQIHLSDINIILENGPLYSNILVGKAPFLASINKPVLSISPIKSELKNIICNTKYCADLLDKDDISSKLQNLIEERLNSKEPVHPFGDYFSLMNFKINLERVLHQAQG